MVFFHEFPYYEGFPKAGKLSPSAQPLSSLHFPDILENGPSLKPKEKAVQSQISSNESINESQRAATTPMVEN